MGNVTQALANLSCAPSCRAKVLQAGERDGRLAAVALAVCLLVSAYLVDGLHVCSSVCPSTVCMPVRLVGQLSVSVCLNVCRMLACLFVCVSVGMKVCLLVCPLGGLSGIEHTRTCMHRRHYPNCMPIFDARTCVCIRAHKPTHTPRRRRTADSHAHDVSKSSGASERVWGAGERENEKKTHARTAHTDTGPHIDTHTHAHAHTRARGAE